MHHTHQLKLIVEGTEERQSLILDIHTKQNNCVLYSPSEVESELQRQAKKNKFVQLFQYKLHKNKATVHGLYSPSEVWSGSEYKGRIEVI